MKMASKKMKTKTAAAIVMTRQKDWFRLNLLRMKYGKRRYKVLAIDILKDPFFQRSTEFTAFLTKSSIVLICNLLSK